MEQVLGEHAELEPLDICKPVLPVPYGERLLTDLQNRAYAVSQLNDLAAKLQKSQSTAQSRRSNPENLTGPNARITVNAAGVAVVTQPGKEKGKDKEAPPDKDGERDGKPKQVEDSALVKAVKDRYALPLARGLRDLTRPHNSTKIASEAQHGLISQMIKDIIFSQRPGAGDSTTTVNNAIETAMAA